MNNEPELRSAVRAWLRADEHEPTERVLKRVVRRLDDTPQVQSTRVAFVMVARRTVSVGTLQLMAIGVVTLLIGFMLGAVRPGLPQGGASASVAAQGRTAAPPSDRYETTFFGTGVHLSLPWPPGWGSWEMKIPGANYLAKSTGGSQGAEAVFAWVYKDNAVPCYYLNKYPRAVRSSDPATLAAAMAEAPGIEVLTAPTPTTVDGRDAVHLVIRLTEDVGCDPGFFYSWPWWLGGEFWGETYPGDTVRIWIVDVDGKPLVLIGATHPDADVSVDPDFLQMVVGLHITTGWPATH